MAPRTDARDGGVVIFLSHRRRTRAAPRRDLWMGALAAAALAALLLGIARRVDARPPGTTGACLPSSPTDGPMPGGRARAREWIGSTDPVRQCPAGKNV